LISIRQFYATRCSRIRARAKSPACEVSWRCGASLLGTGSSILSWAEFQSDYSSMNLSLKCPAAADSFAFGSAQLSARDRPVSYSPSPRLPGQGYSPPHTEIGKSRTWNTLGFPRQMPRLMDRILLPRVEARRNFQNQSKEGDAAISSPLSPSPISPYLLP